MSLLRRSGARQNPPPPPPPPAFRLAEATRSDGGATEMDILTLSIILVVVLFGLLLSGLWVGFSLMAVGAGGDGVDPPRIGRRGFCHQSLGGR